MNSTESTHLKVWLLFLCVFLKTVQPYFEGCLSECCRQILLFSEKFGANPVGEMIVTTCTHACITLCFLLPALSSLLRSPLSEPALHFDALEEELESKPVTLRSSLIINPESIFLPLLILFLTALPLPDSSLHLSCFIPLLGNSLPF